MRDFYITLANHMQEFNVKTSAYTTQEAVVKAVNYLRKVEGDTRVEVTFNEVPDISHYYTNMHTYLKDFKGHLNNIEGNLFLKGELNKTFAHLYAEIIKEGSVHNIIERLSTIPCYINSLKGTSHTQLVTIGKLIKAYADMYECTQTHEEDIGKYRKVD